VDEGYNPSYGARPLRRAIMRLLEDSMAERMLAGDIKEGDSVIIDGALLQHCLGLGDGRASAALGPGSCGAAAGLQAACVQGQGWQRWSGSAVRGPPAWCDRSAACNEPRGAALPRRPTFNDAAPPRCHPACAVDADGQISVLNGDKKMTSAIPTATGELWATVWLPAQA